ncbi:MAG: biopolymer transporter ExbD, partial [Bacteroidales bacterium]|nr:biopolymer transporter ExbD [Bacteroidales bacterium]
EVQNELIRAINEIRDSFAMQNFGKKYANLDEAQQQICRDAIPQNISEAEPKDITKK